MNRSRSINLNILSEGLSKMVKFFKKLLILLLRIVLYIVHLLDGELDVDKFVDVILVDSHSSEEFYSSYPFVAVTFTLTAEVNNTGSTVGLSLFDISSHTYVKVVRTLHHKCF